MKKVTFQIKDGIFSGRHPKPAIAFLQDFRSACDACEINEGAEMSLFTQYFFGLAEAAEKFRMTLPNSVSTGNEEALRPYSKLVNFLFKRNVIEDNTVSLDNEVRGFKQVALSLLIFIQQFRLKILACESVYDEKALRGIIGRGIQSSIRDIVKD